jgi:uncharacterized iron-regulated membrane protein
MRRDSPLRRALVQVHLYAGLFLGLYVLIIGLTGASLVFREEMEDGMIPRIAETPNAQRLNVDEVASALHSTYPGWTLTSLYWPQQSHGTWHGELRNRSRQIAVYVDPVSGKVLWERDYDRSFLRWLQLVHIQLLNGNQGRTVNGVIALLTAALGIIGILLWIPPRQQWKQALSIEWRAPGKRLNRDLHIAGGAYFFLYLILLTITGSYFAWRGPIHGAIAKVLPMHFMNRQLNPVQSSPSAPPAPYAAMEAQARKLVPEYPPARIIFAERPQQPIRIVIYEDKTWHASNIFFDPKTASMVRADLFRNSGPGDYFTYLVGPVHFGEIGGLFTKALWVFGGLAFPLMTITGYWMYAQRLLGKSRTKGEPAPATVRQETPQAVASISPRTGGDKR